MNFIINSININYRNIYKLTQSIKNLYKFSTISLSNQLISFNNIQSDFTKKNIGNISKNNTVYMNSKIHTSASSKVVYFKNY